MDEVIKTQPAEETQSAPKVRFIPKRTNSKKAEPKFTEGELLPWKGMWFKLAQITQSDEGWPVFVIIPQGRLEPIIEVNRSEHFKSSEESSKELVGRGDSILTPEKVGRQDETSEAARD